MTDDQQVEEMAQKLYAEKAAREQAAHGQHTVPWNEIGESLKVSYRRMAIEKLGSTK